MIEIWPENALPTKLNGGRPIILIYAIETAKTLPQTSLHGIQLIGTLRRRLRQKREVFLCFYLLNWRIGSEKEWEEPSSLSSGPGLTDQLLPELSLTSTSSLSFTFLPIHGSDVALSLICSGGGGLNQIPIFAVSHRHKIPLRQRQYNSDRNDTRQRSTGAADPDRWQCSRPPVSAVDATVINVCNKPQ